MNRFEYSFQFCHDKEWVDNEIVTELKKTVIEEIVRLTKESAKSFML
jgi:hypothetical protein